MALRNNRWRISTGQPPYTIMSLSILYCRFPCTSRRRRADRFEWRAQVLALCRRVGFLLILSFMLMSSGSVWAQPPSELNAKMLEAGTFESVWSDEEQEVGPCAPPSLRLDKRTDEVHASLLSRFGFTYMLSGGPAREHVLEIVIRHPAMENPATGQTLAEQSLEITACPGTPAFAGWSFTSGWELVPGTWTVEVRQRDRKLLEKDFEVVIAGEYPQMQLDYSLLPEAADAYREFLRSREETIEFLENAGLGAAHVVGTFPDAEFAEESADSCRAQGKGARVVETSGVLGTTYLLECIDFAQMHSENAKSGERADDSVKSDVELDVAVMPDMNVGALPGESVEGNAAAPGDPMHGGDDPAAVLSGYEELDASMIRPGGYAVLFGLLDSNQAASRYAGVLAETIDVEPEVHRMSGTKRQGLYAVLGPPGTLDEARGALESMPYPDQSPIVVKLAPLQRLARAEQSAPGVGEYDPSLVAMSLEAEAQALEALRRAEESMEDTPSIEEITRMPEDAFAGNEVEEEDPHGWTVQGRTASRFGMQDSPPVSAPSETGVDVLVARTSRRSEAQDVVRRLEESEVNATIRETDHGAYEVRVENVADTRAARRLAERIFSQAGVNATVVLTAGAGESVAPELETSVGKATPYAVQVISTLVRSEAQRYMETLRSRGYDPVLAEVSGKLGAWYSIRIGRYASPEEAEQASSAFSKKEGFSSIVVEDAG
ncbi:hypothetical protein DPQ33_03015 [Oceanidesulfovibrio indonesiensis]|uniref:SPOR domain-containing protein n=2 Tax=Oceanidesulfovibrio indonesiensis TaxID=54767 RepID=A0A7M3MIY0_9BACT|nr:hypothetical protein DPQ33_03015 [Oceanidesulfovibrio indonesiensis]